jgi:hypothetical protein
MRGLIALVLITTLCSACKDDSESDRSGDGGYSSGGSSGKGGSGAEADAGDAGVSGDTALGALSEADRRRVCEELSSSVDSDAARRGTCVLGASIAVGVAPDESAMEACETQLEACLDVPTSQCESMMFTADCAATVDDWTSCLSMAAKQLGAFADKMCEQIVQEVGFFCPAMRQRPAMPAGTDLPSSSTALVALSAAPEGSSPLRPVRRSAGFLAHLIATARHAPQTRERRRAEPEEVIAAYQPTIARLQKFNGQ